MKNLALRYFSVAFLLAFALVLAPTNIATAVDNTSPEFIDEIEPRYTGISKLGANLTINSNGAAQCWGEVRSRSGYTSTLTVSLQQDGTTIKSWSVYGGGLRTVDESYTVEKGHSYQVIASVVVKDSKGTVVDRTSEESRVQSY